jgi:hypothetical protein
MLNRRPYSVSVFAEVALTQSSSHSSSVSVSVFLGDRATRQET